MDRQTRPPDFRGKTLSDPGELGALNTDDWQQLEEAADTLEAAWKESQSVDLEQYLPAQGHPHRRLVLQELIKIDLECRWKKGQQVFLEYYLGRFPELGTIQALPVALIFEEYRVRHQSYGDRPPLEQFQARFPKQFADLKHLVGQHPALPDGERPSVPNQPSGIPTSPSGGIGKNIVLSQAGGYRLIERIGTGGFAEVYKAEAPGGILTAIKIIVRPIDQEEAKREMASMELIKNIRHHFLLASHSFWSYEDRLVILMDLADGSLRDRLNQCKREGKQGLPLPELIKYFRQAAEGLDYLHSKKIFHRDVKPENILLVDGHVRVADFGLAKSQGTRRLMTVSFAGTPLYMPPEAWDDKQHLNGDQYSLAVTYFELRAGRRLFKDAGLPSLMHSHMHETPNLDPLGHAEQEVLQKALSKDPDNRYPSCTAFVQALEKALVTELPLDPNLLPSTPTPGSHSTQTNTIAPGGHTVTSKDLQTPRPSWAPVETEQMGRSMVWPIVTLVLLGVVALLGWQLFPILFPRPGSFTLEKIEPITVNAGETTSFAVVLRRDNFSEPVQLRVFDDPDITVDETMAADESHREAKVRVAPTAALGHRKVKLHASAADFDEEQTIEVTVEPLATLPRPWKGHDLHGKAGYFQPIGTDSLEIAGKTRTRRYYEKIQCIVDGDKPVDFALVHGDELGLHSFYIMVDKVWNNLFAKFAANHPVASPWRLGARRFFLNSTDRVAEAWGAYYPGPWDLNWSILGRIHWTGLFSKRYAYSLPHPNDLGVGGPRGMYPVLRVDIVEANRFAEWLSPEYGALPSFEEWKQAAGFYAKDRGEGPYDGFEADGDVAVNREEPMPVGTARKDQADKKTNDKNGRRCNDMAGNGREWTRTYQGQQVQTHEFVGDLKIVPRNARVLLCGWEYYHPEPLKWEALMRDRPLTVAFFENSDIISLNPRDFTLSCVGFRVVLKLQGD